MKKIYPSKYTNEKVTAHNFLCEEIMERIAKKAGKTLPYKYWYSNEWAKIYKRQVTAAGQLLQEADCLSIMNFLRSKDGQKITSLGLKKQILEGCSKYTNTVIDCEPAEYIEIDHTIFDGIEDISEDETLPSEAKPSLWEKLQ